MGRAQHHLHTAIVGLHAVERGVAIKPADLDITWKPSDVVGSAREARRFLLTAMIVFAAEELAAYATQVLNWRGGDLPEHRSDRLRALGLGDPPYLRGAGVMICQWRNRIIHRQSRADLASAERDALRAAADEIRDKYKGLDVQRLLADFDSGHPTLKDVTVLMAMAITFVRQTDALLPAPNDGAAVSRWLKTLGLLEAVATKEIEARNGGSPDPRARGRQFLRTEEPTLADSYYQHGTA